MINDAYVDTRRRHERSIVIAIVTFIWRHRTAYLKTRGSSRVLDLHQGCNVNWPYDLHRIAESHPAGDPRSTLDRHAIVADRRGGINIARSELKCKIAEEIFIRSQNQQRAKSPQSRSDRDVIVARSPRDRGQDQARSWLPCGEIKATIKAGSKPQFTKSRQCLIRSHDRIKRPRFLGQNSL